MPDYLSPTQRRLAVPTQGAEGVVGHRRAPRLDQVHRSLPRPPRARGGAQVGGRARHRDCGVGAAERRRARADRPRRWMEGMGAACARARPASTSGATHTGWGRRGGYPLRMAERPKEGPDKIIDLGIAEAVDPDLLALKMRRRARGLARETAVVKRALRSTGPSPLLALVDDWQRIKAPRGARTAQRTDRPSRRWQRS